MLLKYFLYIDIIYIWEYGLCNSFSSLEIISRWVYFSANGGQGGPETIA